MSSSVAMHEEDDIDLCHTAVWSVLLTTAGRRSADMCPARVLD